MKNLKFILLFTVSIAMLSCGNDDDSSGPDLTAANITGTYNLTFLEFTDVVTRVLDVGTIVTTTEGVADTFDDSNIVFNANGTFTVEFQYRITTTRTTTIDGEETSGTYSINEEDETITFDNESIADITRFNGDELRIEFNDTFIEDNITEVITEEFRFERQ